MQIKLKDMMAKSLTAKTVKGTHSDNVFSWQEAKEIDSWRQWRGDKECFEKDSEWNRKR